MASLPPPPAASADPFCCDCIAYPIAGVALAFHAGVDLGRALGRNCWIVGKETGKTGLLYGKAAVTTSITTTKGGVEVLCLTASLVGTLAHALFLSFREGAWSAGREGVRIGKGLVQVISFVGAPPARLVRALGGEGFSYARAAFHTIGTAFAALPPACLVVAGLARAQATALLTTTRSLDRAAVQELERGGLALLEGAYFLSAPARHFLKSMALLTLQMGAAAGSELRTGGTALYALTGTLLALSKTGAQALAAHTWEIGKAAGQESITYVRALYAAQKVARAPFVALALSLASSTKAYVYAAGKTAVAAAYEAATFLRVLGGGGVAAFLVSFTKEGHRYLVAATDTVGKGGRALLSTLPVVAGLGKAFFSSLGREGFALLRAGAGSVKNLSVAGARALVFVARASGGTSATIGKEVGKAALAAFPVLLQLGQAACSLLYDLTTPVRTVGESVVCMTGAMLYAGFQTTKEASSALGGRVIPTTGALCLTVAGSTAREGLRFLSAGVRTGITHSKGVARVAQQLFPTTLLSTLGSHTLLVAKSAGQEGKRLLVGGITGLVRTVQLLSPSALAIGKTSLLFLVAGLRETGRLLGSLQTNSSNVFRNLVYLPLSITYYKAALKTLLLYRDCKKWVSEKYTALSDAIGARYQALRATIAARRAHMRARITAIQGRIQSLVSGILARFPS